jgi:hypothetical protein
MVVSSSRQEGYRVASKLMLDDRWLRHAGLFPWFQVRFGRTDTLRFQQVGHGQRETLPADKLGTLKSTLLHYPFEKGLHDWIEKHNRYSSAEASANITRKGPVSLNDLFFTDHQTRRRNFKALFARLPCRPALRFLYMFIWRRGVLDGRAGWTYCRLLAWYERMIVLKERELRRRLRS